ncbi:MAG: sulfatase-like hydrolase/transferase [Gemmatimonadaceae bacterium]|nr:sulfatase-like hydrolase/transferase [Gemmatimonadaceae bacterium]
MATLAAGHPETNEAGAHALARAIRRLSAGDYFVALSLAHLCFLRVWLEILAVNGPGAYFLDVSNTDFAAAAINTLLLALLFLAAAAVGRAYGAVGRAVLVWALFALIFVQLLGLGPTLSPGVFALVDRWRNGQVVDALVPIVVMALLGIGMWRRTDTTLRIVRRVLLVLAPFAAVTLGRAAWAVLAVDPSDALAAEAPAMGSKVPERDGPRVVVIMMDALSRRHAIDARPADLQLPELDRLRAQSIDATQVSQFANKTILSVPAMLTGLAVENSEPQDADELLITVNGRARPWSKAPNVLQSAQALGGAAVIAGWYHPYCRVFRSLDACSSYPTRTVGSRARHTGFWRAVVDQQLALIPYVNLRIRQIDIVEEQVADAERAVTLGDRGLIFLHLIVPHTPWIWDDEDDEFTLTEFDPDGYYGNIALMDRVLGDLRARMEAAGKWDDTAVLFLSDHIMRYRPDYLEEPDDPRIPYILKLPGQRQGATFDRPLNAIITHDLLEALLRGELTSEAEAMAWLAARETTGRAVAASPPR